MLQCLLCVAAKPYKMCEQSSLGFSHFHSPTHICSTYCWVFTLFYVSCKCIAFSQTDSVPSPMQSHIEYGAGIIMANHFRNHVTENVHHIKLSSIMHVCTPILIICVYRTLHCIRSTNIVFADDMLAISSTVPLAVSPIREGLHCCEIADDTVASASATAIAIAIAIANWYYCFSNFLSTFISFTIFMQRFDVSVCRLDLLIFP